MVLYNDGSYAPRVELGITSGAGRINLKDNNGYARAVLSASGTGLEIADANQYLRSYIRETTGAINNSEIATQLWVEANYGTAIKASGNYVWLPNGCYLECLSGRLILHADALNYISIASTGSQVFVNGTGHNI